MKKSQMNLNEMCRCCRQEGLAMASIFDANEHDPGGAHIDEMLMVCGGIGVHRGDGFPEYLCLTCLHRVKDAFALRNQLQQSHDTFLQSGNRKSNSHTENSALIQKLFEFLPAKEENVEEEDEGNVEITHESDEEVTGQPPNRDSEEAFDEYCQIEQFQQPKSEIEIAEEAHVVSGKSVKREIPNTRRCNECKKTYSSVKSLRLHLKRYHDLKKLYECIICMKRYNRIEHMKKHLVLHLKEKPFSCEECHRDFNRKENYIQHLAICDNTNSLACNVCNKKFLRKDVLETHKKIHDESDSKIQIASLTIEDLQDWRKFCRDVDPTDANSNAIPPLFSEICEYDSKLGSNDDEKQSHLLSINQGDFTDESAIKSDEYNLRNVDRGKQRNKMKTSPSFTEVYSDTQTDEEFLPNASKKRPRRKQLSDVNKTVLEIETNEDHLVKGAKKTKGKTSKAKSLAICERQFKCRECSKAFKQKAHLVEHTKIHDVNAKKFLCSECGMRFIRNDFLVIHMRRHRGEKPYKCTFCGKGFARVNDLTVHERYHTGEKSHLCTICGHGFNRSYNLTIHMRKHTGEKPYKCPYCESAFSQRNDMKAHIRRHTGERFRCDLCPEAFLMKYMLTNHQRCTHGLNVVSSTGRLNPMNNKLLQDSENASAILQ